VSRVLVISNDYVRRAMAGPAIRSVELARQLHRAGNIVTLSAPNKSDLTGEPYRLLAYDPRDRQAFRDLAGEVDVVVLQGWVLARNPLLRTAGARLVVDLYDPFPLEHLAMGEVEDQPRWLTPWDDVLGTLLEQVRLGDFFLCASERQRDFWLGMLLALNRVNADTYGQDPSLRSLVDVVAFGVAAEPPRRRGPAMRGVLPGIGADDLVLLWAGGVYDWFDPLTLVEAVGRAAKAHPRLRLCFLATAHPNPDVSEMEMLRRTRHLSAELGLTGEHVIFNEAWVPYDARADWLLEADVGVSTHMEHVETRLSFRTRILDYLWAGLPVLCTTGDSLAELVEHKDAGITVPPGDVGALERAICELAADPEGRARRSRGARSLARDLTWERAARTSSAVRSRPPRPAASAGSRCGGWRSWWRRAPDRWPGRRVAG
jgi:glycosyltransferase involved in cell wall biosynthesis